MLIRIVRMTFRENKVDAFLDLFNQTKKNIKNFPGCNHLELLQDYHRQNVFTTYSHWEDDGALDHYRHSELFKETWSNTKPLFSAKPVAFSLREYMKV